VERLAGPNRRCHPTGSAAAARPVTVSCDRPMVLDQRERRSCRQTPSGSAGSHRPGGMGGTETFWFAHARRSSVRKDTRRFRQKRHRLRLAELVTDRGQKAGYGLWAIRGGRTLVGRRPGDSEQDRSSSGNSWDSPRHGAVGVSGAAGGSGYAPDSARDTWTTGTGQGLKAVTAAGSFIHLSGWLLVGAAMTNET